MPCVPCFRVELQSFTDWKRTCNHYSLELRTYLHFGDSVFSVTLQVTANASVSLVATFPTLFSVDRLGNGLLSDHAQADLLSARSERQYFVPWRISLVSHKHLSQATKPSSNWNTVYSYWASFTNTICSVLFKKRKISSFLYSREILHQD